MLNGRGRLIEIVKCMRLDNSLIMLELTVVIESLNNIGCIFNIIIMKELITSCANETHDTTFVCLKWVVGLNLFNPAVRQRSLRYLNILYLISWKEKLISPALISVTFHLTILNACV